MQSATDLQLVDAVCTQMERNFQIVVVFGKFY